MVDFITVPPPTVPPDPDKRVKYSLGLVLGVDELEQEQYYFLERGRQHNRALHGYGTVCGLDLVIQGTEVRVRGRPRAQPAGQDDPCPARPVR